LRRLCFHPFVCRRVSRLQDELIEGAIGEQQQRRQRQVNLQQMWRWRLEDAPELRSAGGQPHERRTCPLQPQVRRSEEEWTKDKQKRRKREGEKTP